MKTFERYFIHLFGICMSLFVFFLVLLAIDENELFSPIFVIPMFMCIVGFSALMALFCNDIAQLKIMMIKSQDVSKDQLKLEEIINLQFNRTVRQESDGKIIYKMKSKYKAWLTNPIIMDIRGEQIYISIPNQYVEYLRKEFPVSILLDNCIAELLKTEVKK